MIRVANETWDLPDDQFEQHLKHEVCHVLLDGLMEEYMIQVDRLPPEFKDEYIERYKTATEKIVEHLSYIL